MEILELKLKTLFLAATRRRAADHLEALLSSVSICLPELFISRGADSLYSLSGVVSYFRLRDTLSILSSILMRDFSITWLLAALNYVRGP